MNPIQELVKLFISSGKTKFAIEFIENLNDLADELGKLFILGMCFYELGEYDSAISNFNKCMKYDLNDEQLDDLNFNLGMAHADKMETGVGLVFLHKVKNKNISAHIELVERRHKEIQGVNSRGYWSVEASKHHVHDANLAKWLSSLLNTDKITFDFGCGTGYYLKHLFDKGFKKLYGFEGILPCNLEFKKVIKQDLTEKFKTNKKGNVICLEVAEHIPKVHTEIFLDNISRACDDLLIMSWAVRGQMGIGHVNCRNNDEAIEIVESKGFLYNEKLTLAGRNSVSDVCEWFRRSLLVFNRQYLQKAHRTR
jgi:hypothetical protein